MNTPRRRIPRRQGRIPIRRRRINNRRNRRMRGTVVRVHNRRPMVPQTDPHPLNYGAGGLSTTLRVVRTVTIDVKDDKKNSLNVANMVDQISLKDIFEGYPMLNKHYSQIRINSAKAVLTGHCGVNAKSLLAFALVPNKYADNMPAVTSDNFASMLDSGVIVLKHAYRENAAAWLPTEPNDYEYLDLSSDTEKSLFQVLILMQFIPTEFPLIKDLKYAVAMFTLDINVNLRGRAPQGLPALGEFQVNGRRPMEVTLVSDSTHDNHVDDSVINVVE